VIVHKFNVHSENYAIVAVISSRKQEERTRVKIRHVERWETTALFWWPELLVFLLVSE
jgi:ribosomal protein L14E/L6E/L27E